MKPVVALDIDGTLVDYHAHFLWFANGYFNTNVDEYAYQAPMPMYTYLGVSKASYRKCKLAYRRGELKRSVPELSYPYPSANTLTHTLRRMGFDIWLCTTRPYLSHDAVDDATRHNLRRNGVVYQGLIWGEHKYRELVRTVGKARVVGVLDDLPEMCAQAEGLGLRSAFALRRHNHEQFVSMPAGTYAAVKEEEDTVALFRAWLKEWRDAGQR